MRTTRAYEGVSLRDWSASVLRAVGLIRRGMTIEDAAAKAKADIESVRQAWAIHAATPEGKAHAKANERVRVLGAEERAKVEAELKARDGAPGLRAEVEQLRQRLAQAEGLAAHQAAQRDEASSTAFMEGLGRAKAERERDEARAEVERLTSKNEQLRGLLGDQRRLREQTEERLRVEEQQAAKEEARADAAEDQTARLAAQVKGIRELVAAVARIEAALAEGTREKDVAIARAERLRDHLLSYQPDWEELAARRAGTWRADR